MSRLPAQHLSRRRRSRAALTLIELMVCIVIIAVVLVEMQQQNTNAMASFDRARDNLSGTWMASTLINELMCEELPNFEGAADGDRKGYLSGGGTFADFLSRSYPDVYDQMSENRREQLELWTYQWTKEVVLINSKGEKRTDSSGEPPDYLGDAENLTDEDVANNLEDDPNYEDPRELADLPTAQVIRIRLVLSPPGAEGTAPADVSTGVIGAGNDGELYDPERRMAEPEVLDDDTRAEQNFIRRKHIVLIRYIDIENLRKSLVAPPPQADPGANR